MIFHLAHRVVRSVSARASEFAVLLAVQDEGWPVHFGMAAAVGLVVGLGVSWVLTRSARRIAASKADQLVDVARREAAVAAEEAKQRAEAEIQLRRAEANREFDRREIEVDLKLRELRSHEESLVILDRQMEQREERLSRETAAVRQAS